MKIEPIGEQVCVKRDEKKDKTEGGIILPDVAKHKTSFGTVIAVGPGGRNKAGEIIPMLLKVGDRVLFPMWGGSEVRLDGEDYLMLKESDVFGKVTGE